MNSTPTRQLGLFDWLTPVTLPRAESMPDRSETCAPPTSTAPRKPISSRASAPGPTRYDLLAGMTPAPSGPALALVSPSPLSASDAALRTSGTSGPSGSGSSASAALQSSLESRLTALMVVGGSTPYRLTWKVKATPSGRRVFVRQASALPMSDRESTTWLTPQARDWKGYTIRGGQTVCDQLRRLYGGTGKPNPRWTAWLMGLPAEEWLNCAPLATRSSRKSPRRSSEP